MLQNTNLTAIIIHNGKHIQVKSNKTLLSVLNRLDIIPDTILATRDGELITEDTHLQEGDIVKLINIISGG